MALLRQQEKAEEEEVVLKRLRRNAKFTTNDKSVKFVPPVECGFCFYWSGRVNGVSSQIAHSSIDGLGGEPTLLE